MKKILAVTLVGMMVMGMMVFSFADGVFGPASIFADLIDVSEDEAYDLKLESGLTFGELAEKYDVYEAFKDAAFGAKELWIAELVAKDELTQAEADEILAALAACDGTQTHILRDQFNLGQKMMNGQGNGQRLQDGSGAGGQGAGKGNGNRRGRN
ncbi:MULTISPECIES: hypothetical protein [unclassified Fusibacter]|uniref:hypothetical protein n=1 Tax=unclassified Fusibacter TaxID=2624464 RepID=UPI0010105A36|nr:MULTISPECIES: hypothetical protein [unclassified Fusibacter]MCK8058577.1 hypothetical protein [Fusibacter sp. A2]NPE22653.1 hypothetical protein [Fusibacter sp. A1]RXV60216.1 hypothetical protein DWB64_12450 [Fusibacter sp. A1]